MAICRHVTNTTSENEQARLVESHWLWGLQHVGDVNPLLEVFCQLVSKRHVELAGEQVLRQHAWSRTG